jgi:ABC-type multidrug transport system permease subunit
VAVVTVPADFDTQLRNNAPVQVDVQINNLNTDFTNDIRRAIPLSITSFYGKAFPNVVSITPAEHDLQPQDTDYIPYLTVSILVVALMVGCMLQAGMAAAHEWETSTIKELLLSPASRWAITVGQMAGALILALMSAVIVFVILTIFVGVWPAHWAEVIGFALLTMIIFIAWGTLLGTLVKRRQALAALALGVSLPLFFLSGPFGPISFFTGLVPIVAQLFPPYYAIVLQQHAFHGFDLNTYGIGGNALILSVYTVALVGVTALVLRRSTVAN